MMIHEVLYVYLLLKYYGHAILFSLSCPTVRSAVREFVVVATRALLFPNKQLLILRTLLPHQLIQTF